MSTLSWIGWGLVSLHILWAEPRTERWLCQTTFCIIKVGMHVSPYAYYRFFISSRRSLRTLLCLLIFSFRFHKIEDRFPPATACCLWFDHLFYYRLALAVNTALACLKQASTVVCMGKGATFQECWLMTNTTSMEPLSSNSTSISL